jgi:hypothetical protein
MGFENILTFDFIPLITGWALIYLYCYAVKEEPIGLQEIEDLEEREIKRHEFYTNYPSLLHAVSMVFMSKFMSKLCSD